MSSDIIQRSRGMIDRRAVLPWVVAAGVGALLIAIGAKLLNDPDTYWQIALGDWILAHRQVPHVDTFSATMAGHPWISSQWLAQVLFAQAYALAGWAGVVTLTVLAIAAAQGLLTRFLLERLAVTPALVLSLSGFVVAAPHMVARAHALALPVMVTWIAGLIRAADERRTPSLLLLPLMTVWANLHGGFTFGIFFIGATALDALWNAPPADRLRVFMRWAGFAALSVIAACITPYGPESILVTARILGLGQALMLINEWRPQDFAIFTGFEGCLLLGLGLCLYRGLTLPPVRILMLLGLLHMALSHSRSVDALGFLAPLVLAAPLAPQIGSRTARDGRTEIGWTAGLVLALILTLASAGIAKAMRYEPNARVTPAKAVAAIKASGKSHILNSYDFGGYLIASGLRPFIDGRTELYGEAFFMRVDRALSLRDIDGLLRLLRDYDIDATLLSPNSPAVGLLDHLKGWRRAYADDTAVVHVRTAAKEAGELQ